MGSSERVTRNPERALAASPLLDLRTDRRRSAHNFETSVVYLFNSIFSSSQYIHLAFIHP